MVGVREEERRKQVKSGRIIWKESLMKKMIGIIMWKEMQ